MARRTKLGLLIIGLLCVSVSVAQTHPASANFTGLSAKADAARDAEHLDEAVILYRKALALRPSWTEGWWSLGTILYDQNSYSAASRAFRQLLIHDPKNGTARLMLGLCQYELNLDDSALTNIRAATKLGIRKENGNQLQHVLQYHEGMLLLRKGQYESAIDVLRFLVRDEVNSEELDAALGMGVLLMRPKSAPAAGSPEYQIVLRAGRAERNNLAKKLDDARNQYAAIAQEFSNFPNIHYAYGRFLLGADNPEEAVVQFKQEIANNPAHTRARLQIAASYYRSDPTAGIPYAAEVVKRDPKYPFGHYLLGLLYFDANDTANAIPELETAARMAPKEAQFQFALGNAYARAGRKEDAARARTRFRLLQAPDQFGTESTSSGDSKPLIVPPSDTPGLQDAPRKHP